LPTTPQPQQQCRDLSLAGMKEKHREACSVFY
jgi:hypothetical protein